MGDVVEAGGDLLRAAREFAAGQRLQHQGRNQPVAKERDFFGFGVHELLLLLDGSLRRKASRFHANGVWGGSGGRRGGGECGAAAVGSQTARPAQQVAAHAGKQEAMSGDPADGFEHGQGAGDEVGRGSGLGQRGQCGAQRFGLRAKAANPELAALVGHGGGAVRAAAVERLPRSRRATRNSAITVTLRPQIGQDELGQQRDGAPAGVAQVAAHADDAVEGGVDERAGVEAVCGEGLFGLALRTVAGAVAIGVGQLLGILLQTDPANGCRICIGSASGSCELPRFVLRRESSFGWVSGGVLPLTSISYTALGQGWDTAAARDPAEFAALGSATASRSPPARRELI